MHAKILALACLLAALGSLASAQARPAGRYDEFIALVGLRLDELVARFGAPSAVHAARGAEEWQDDVVFVYPFGDLYVHRDRVWQVGLGAFYGMSVGDPRAVADLILGEPAAAQAAQAQGDFIVRQLQPLPGMGWPVAMRVNFSAGAISAIFVYRSDF